MSDVTDKDAAFDELVRLVQPARAPKLTNDELEEILDRNQRGRRWIPNSALSLGTVVLPSVRMGHVFRVTKEGTTGTSEPIWPTGEDDTVVDGSAILIEVGSDFTNVYNVRGAAEDCLALKERKAIQLSVTDPNFAHMSQECREQRKSLASVLIA